MSSWFNSMTRFFGRLTSRQDNRTRPLDEDESLAATKDEIIEWERVMQEKVRNKLRLKEMKSKTKRERFLESTNTNIGGRRLTQDYDTKSELGLIEKLNKVKETQEECNIENDYSDMKPEIGYNDSDEESSSESSRSENSQVNMSEEGPPEHPIMDKDEFSEIFDEAEAETDESSANVDSDELELLEKQRDYEQSNDKDSESGIHLDDQNDNLQMICDSESGIDLEDRNKNICNESKSKENVLGLGRRRIPQGVSKTVECYVSDITPTISDENVGNMKSIETSTMEFPAAESRKSLENRRSIGKSTTKLPATENRKSIGKSTKKLSSTENRMSIGKFKTKLPATENQKSIGKSTKKLSSTENRMSIGKSKTKLPATENQKLIEKSATKLRATEEWVEEAPLTEYWVKRSPAIRNLENEEVKIVNYYILPEKPEAELIQTQQDKKEAEPIEKPVISQHKVIVAHCKKTKHELNVDQNANPVEVEEKSLTKNLPLESIPSPNVTKSTQKTGESSSTVGFLRRGVRWIGSKITPKKESRVGTTTGNPPQILPKLRTGGSLIKSSKEDITVSRHSNSSDPKRVKMLSYLKGSRADGSQGESLSRIHDGVFHQSDGDGGRRGRNFLKENE